MGKVEQFEDHPVHASLEQIANSLSGLEEAASEDPTTLELYAHVDAARRHALQALASCDPILVPTKTLDNINQQAQQIVQQLSNFTSNKNADHLKLASGHAESLTAQVRGIPVVLTADETDSLKDSIASFRKSAGQHLRYLEADVEKAESELSRMRQQVSETGQEIQSQKGRLDQAIAGFQEQFSKAEQERASQFTTSLKDRGDQFQKIHDEWRSKLANALEKHEGSFADLMKTAEGEHEEAVGKMKTAGEHLVNDLEGYKEEAEKLVHVIAATGMAGGYQSVADREGKRANLWHGVAVLSIAALIGFAIYAFIHTLEPQVRWSVFGARMFVAAAFALAAAYAGRQADRHRSLEQRNRRWQLVLASVNPYLADLPEEKQQLVKEHVAERIFTASDPEVEEASPVTPNMLYDMLRLVLDNLSKRA